MDGGTFGLLKFLFPQIPSLASTAVWHSLGRSPTSSKWDLRTTLTVEVLRNLMNGGGRKPSPVGKVQATTLKDPGIKGKLWVAKATMQAPTAGEESLVGAVIEAIEDMKPEGAGSLDYTKPELAAVEVEWTGYRPNAGSVEGLPDITEEVKYNQMLAEPSRTSNTTILYFHGGAYYLCDPATHRALCSQLAKETHGRVCNVRYRLAPQTSFPGQLLDALMVYLTLLYPPPGSMHEAVPAKDIVFAGDSAGGNLSIALLQLLLQFHRTSDNPTLRFHGKDVHVPLPAGASANSGWFDISRAMPSLMTNLAWDYLPPPNDDEPITSRFPPDEAWPSKPARGDFFCDLSLLDHPLVSPLAAGSWENSPPMFLCLGQEMLADEVKVVASQAASQGVQVQYEEYEAMPHCFALLLQALPAADKLMSSWGDFCRRCVEEPGSVKTNGHFYHAKTLKEDSVDVPAATDISLPKAQKLMSEAKGRRVQAHEKAMKTMPRSTL